jgi:endonuclease-3 related protein
LNLNGIRSVPQHRLESLIRPAGYFRQKVTRLRAFVAFLDRHYRGSLNRMFAQPTEVLRRELLQLKGVGPETADAILLYAGRHPSFVVDAYTRRILLRHGLVHEKADYDDIRDLCQRALRPLPASSNLEVPEIPTRPLNPASSDIAHRPSPMSRASRPPLAQIYNEMHALLVGVGKRYCLKSNPHCEHCPLQRFLPERRPCAANPSDSA